MDQGRVRFPVFALICRFSTAVVRPLGKGDVWGSIPQNGSNGPLTPVICPGPAAGRRIANSTLWVRPPPGPSYLTGL